MQENVLNQACGKFDFSLGMLLHVSTSVFDVTFCQMFRYKHRLYIKEEPTISWLQICEYLSIKISKIAHDLNLDSLAKVAQLVKWLLWGMGGHGFNPGP